MGKLKKNVGRGSGAGGIRPTYPGKEHQGAPLKDIKFMGDAKKTEGRPKHRVRPAGGEIR